MKYLIPFVVLFLGACSPQGQSPSLPVVNSQNATTSTLIEFGSFTPTGSQKLMSATIYNDTGANLAGPATLSSSDFSFMSVYNCSAGAKNRTSCSTTKLLI